MSLTLYFHPLSSFCHKVLISLYENDTPFVPHLVNLQDEAAAAAFKKIWPIGKFPVLRDDDKNRTVAESSIIIEYLDQHYPGRTRLIPHDVEKARETRMADRFYDLHVHHMMQKIISDRLRPQGQKDIFGVDDAKKRLWVALEMIESDMAGKRWAVDDTFSMADCAAAPALFYADVAMPFRATHKAVAGYLDRLMERPSYARALKEAEPYFAMIPKP